MLIDCFYFNDQIDILEIRLNELYDSVDKFVFFECDKYLGNFQKKEYFYEKYQERFKKFQDKIEYYKIEILEEKLTDYDDFVKIFDAFIKSVKDKYKNYDKIIISCVEEIWKSSLKSVISKQKTTVQLEMDRFTCFYNTKCGKSYGARALDVCDYKSFGELRDSFLEPSKKYPVIKNSGWHFEYIAPKDGIRRLIERSQYASYWEQSVLNDINLNIDNNLNPYREVMNIVGINQNYLPEYICSNRERFIQQNKVDKFVPTIEKFKIEIPIEEKKYYKKIIEECPNMTQMIYFGDSTGESLKYLLELISESSKIISLDVLNNWNKDEFSKIMKDLSQFSLKFINFVESDPLEKLKNISDEIDLCFIRNIENNNFFDQFLKELIPKMVENGKICGTASKNTDLRRFFGHFALKNGFFEHNCSKIDFKCSNTEPPAAVLTLILDLRNKNFDSDDLEQYLSEFENMNQQISLNIIILTKNSGLELKNNQICLDFSDDYQFLDIFEVLIKNKYINSEFFHILKNINKQNIELLTSLYLSFSESSAKVCLSKYFQKKQIHPKDNKLFEQWDGRIEQLIDKILNSEMFDFDLSCYLFRTDIPIDKQYEEFLVFDNEYEHFLKTMLVSVAPFEIVYTGVPYVSLV